MSGILSGLTDYDINPFDLGTMYENPEGGGQYVLKDDVADALRNPTDERRALLGKALYEAVTRNGLIEACEWVLLRPDTRRQYEDAACVVLAALAGGDR